MAVTELSEKKNYLKNTFEEFFLWFSTVYKRTLNHKCLRMVWEQLWRLLGPNLTNFPKRTFDLETRSYVLFLFSCSIINKFTILTICPNWHNAVPSLQGSLYFQRRFLRQWKLSSCPWMSFMKGKAGPDGAPATLDSHGLSQGYRLMQILPLNWYTEKSVGTPTSNCYSGVRSKFDQILVCWQIILGFGRKRAFLALLANGKSLTFTPTQAPTTMPGRHHPLQLVPRAQGRRQTACKAPWVSDSQIPSWEHSLCHPRLPFSPSWSLSPAPALTRAVTPCTVPLEEHVNWVPALSLGPTHPAPAEQLE